MPLTNAAVIDRLCAGHPLWYLCRRLIFSSSFLEFRWNKHLCTQIEGETVQAAEGKMF